MDYNIQRVRSNEMTRFALRMRLSQTFHWSKISKQIPLNLTNVAEIFYGFSLVLNSRFWTKYLMVCLSILVELGEYLNRLLFGSDISTYPFDI